MTLREDFWRTLKQYPIEQVQSAIETWIQSDDFFPWPGKIKSEVQEIRRHQLELSVPLLTEPEPTEEDNRVGKLVCRWISVEQPKLHGKSWPEIQAAMKAYFLKHNIPWKGDNT